MVSIFIVNFIIYLLTEETPRSSLFVDRRRTSETDEI